MDATIISCGRCISVFIEPWDKCPSRKAGVQHPFSLSAVKVEKLLHKPELSLYGRNDMLSATNFLGATLWIIGWTVGSINAISEICYSLISLTDLFVIGSFWILVFLIYSPGSRGCLSGFVLRVLSCAGDVWVTGLFLIAHQCHRTAPGVWKRSKRKRMLYYLIGFNSGFRFMLCWSFRGKRLMCRWPVTKFSSVVWNYLIWSPKTIARRLNGVLSLNATKDFFLSGQMLDLLHRFLRPIEDSCSLPEEKDWEKDWEKDCDLTSHQLIFWMCFLFWKKIEVRVTAMRIIDVEREKGKWSKLSDAIARSVKGEVFNPFIDSGRTYVSYVAEERM